MSTLYRDFLHTFLGIVIGSTLIANAPTFLAIIALVIVVCLVGMVIFVDTNLTQDRKAAISLNAKKLAITLLSVSLVVGSCISGIYFISILSSESSMYVGLFSVLLVAIVLIIIMPFVSMFHDVLIRKLKG